MLKLDHSKFSVLENRLSTVVFGFGISFFVTFMPIVANS